MQIDFDKRYPVASTPEQAWAVLADIRATAACWPGAAIATQVDTRHYQGTMGLQVGEEAVRLDGGIELLGMDAARRELRLRGHGREMQGSDVSAELVARVDPGDVPGASALVSRATLTVDGRLAQLDRRLLVTAGDRLLAQFAENFRAAAAAAPAPKALRHGGESKRGAKRSSSGADSTLTLMVEAGQAPGAAFAAQEGSGSAAPAPTEGGPLAGLRRWLAGLFGRGER